VPVSLVHHQRLDALWNEDFKHLVRHAILGEAAPGLSFEDTVRRLVDCRRLGFSDGAQQPAPQQREGPHRGAH
jgi:pullulanase